VTGAVHPIKWKAKYGGLDVSEARRPSRWKRETAAEELLAESDAGQRSAEGPARKKTSEAVAAEGGGCPTGRAALAELGARMQAGRTHRSSMHYRPRRPDDSLLRQRCASWLPSADASAIGAWDGCSKGKATRAEPKKLYRLYRQEKLRCAAVAGASGRLELCALALPAAVNRRWSLDFVSDCASETAVASAFCAWSTTQRECLAAGSIPRWVACVWCGNWSGW